ncbi:MAG: glucose-6-phosphate isomerase, partial [Proteobacteria bacterium]|nr:glucose-6-phosphate isomerase [Pseudomonadota bacterium]
MEQWKSITDCGAFAALESCAQNPFDLTRPGALTPERLLQFRCSGPEFDLLYGCQRVTSEVLDLLQSLADECQLVEQFRQMRRGTVMNRIHGWPSEERQVLHTSSRDLFSAAPACLPATKAAQKELAKLKIFLNEVENGGICNSRGEPFVNLIHIGIGGSDLGPRSIYEALRSYKKKGRKVSFISNVDPDDAAAVLDGLDLSRTLVSVVSKSGTTLETLSNEILVRTALREAGLDPAKHCLAVTGEASPMDNPERYLRSFYMYD